MATPTNSPQEHNIYYTDPENAAEMARLTKQARLLTHEMGGPLPEQSNLERIDDILDLACGPGEWAMETAHMYPDKQVTGVDVSQLMINYANFQAKQHEMSNLTFKVMDILQPLDFPDQSFDLVNIRLIASFMFRSHGWPRLVEECVRITRPGGIIRLTDCEWFISTSPVCEEFFALCVQAVHLAGNDFSPNGHHMGTTPMLGRFLRDAGCQNVRHKGFAVDCSYGAEGHQGYYEDMMVFLKLLQPLLVQTGVASKEEAEILYQRTLQAIQQPNFNCIWYFLTAWGERP